ncbi:RAM signaling network component [Thecaphora frezii]
MSRSPMTTSYTATASAEGGRHPHYPTLMSSSSVAASRPAAHMDTSFRPISEWQRPLAEPDGLSKALPEAWSSSTSQLAHIASNSRSMSSASQHRPITDAELMSLVIEKRLKASPESFQAAETRARSGSTSARERGREDGRMTSQTRRDAKDGQEINTRDTLDLCYMRIEKLPERLVDVIKDDLVRLALGYNFIAKIPDNFADLRHVRYLNVRANNLTSFPAAICKMPSLEILDISRNKIRVLPTEPGRLLSLRVLSLNSNRLTRLLPWVGKMKHLRVLKMDNNPLEWPPPHISKMPPVALQKPPSSAGNGAVERDVVRKYEERQMVVWIAKLKSWINESQATQRLESPMLASADSDPPFEEIPNGPDVLALPVTIPDPASTEASLTDMPAAEVGHASDQSDSPVTPKNHQMKGGDDSSWSQLPAAALEARSASSNEMGEREALLLYDRHHNSPRQLSSDHAQEPVPPIPKQFSPHTPSGTHLGSALEERLLTSSANLSALTGRAAEPALAPYLQEEHELSTKSQHGRNNSHSIGQAASPLQSGARRTLNAKKSLPDMRLSHEDILTERSHGVRMPNYPTNLGPGSDAPHKQSTSLDSGAPMQASMPPPRRPTTAPRRPPLPQSASNPVGYHSKPGGWGSSTPSPSQMSGSGSAGGGLRKLSLPTVGATQAAAEAAAAAMAAKQPYTHTPPRIEGHGRMPSDKGDSGLSSRSDSPTIVRNPADFERNSYFRRLSTLPPSTISKAVPLPVLKFVDGTRGVLFALSQIHAALKQYILFAADERISSQFNRVLDIASGSMTTFINSLDRFDSLSLRGTPEPSVIRGVLMTCKESVLTFRKVVSVLQLQLRALHSSADVRFTRTLLLMLYGSMAEVSSSWTAMAPQVDAVLPYLTAESNASAPGPSLIRQNSGLLKSSTVAANPPSLPSIAEAPSTSRSSRPYNQPLKPNRRRHAGSFSAQDVAQGANIPPSTSHIQPFNLEDLQASAVYGTPARSIRRPAPASGATLHTSSASGSGSTFDYFSSSQGTQSSGTAPATPGPSAHGLFGKAMGASSAPASPSKIRANSNGSSNGETSGFMASGLSGMTPITPVASTAAPSSRHHQPKKHSKSLSNSNSAAMGMLPGLGAGKVTIDDHLLILVDQITSISEDVWSSLLTHLTGLGIESQPVTPIDPTPSRSQPDAITGLGDRERGTAQEATDRVDGRLAVAETAAALLKKLRDLRDLTHSTAELTSRLRETYYMVREDEEQMAAAGLPNDAAAGVGEQDGVAMAPSRGAERTALDFVSQDLVRKLFEEAHQFVRAIVNISTLIKTISNAHSFPRELRRSLGEVTHGCSALTVHLLWLSPTSIS